MSEIELGPLPKYDDVRFNAYWSKIAIDSRLLIDDIDVDCYKNHLQDCEKNPTIGLIAGKKYTMINKLKISLKSFL